MMMDGTGMMAWGFFSFLLGLVVIFLFIVVLVAAVKWLWGQKAPLVQWSGERGLDILKKRYARGEIDKEEYERIKKGIE